jgi:K+-transporting ATPase ATPase C chain
MKQLKISIMAMIIFTIIVGGIYPAFMTLVGNTLFKQKANGSIIYKDGIAVASKLIGQQFTSPKYLWGRPSATSQYQYNALASAGSNLAPSNPDLYNQVKQRAESFKKYSSAPVPIDLVTSSASGLDPEISIAAAYYQIPRIAMARGLSNEKIKAIIDHYSSQSEFGFGAPRVNVVQVNLALDKINSSNAK